jgi:hypothetical protein
MRYAAAAFALLVSLSATFASQPGQPLDCSDWVSEISGYSCEELSVPFDRRGSNLAVDNQGFKLYIDRADGNFKLARLDPSSGVQQVIGRIDTRDAPNSSCDQIDGTPMCPAETLTPWQCHGSLWQSEVVVFDPIGGTLLIPVISSSPCGNTPNYSDTYHTLRIRGFATLFDVLQTYTPPPSQLSFRVPYMPEGLGGVDHFDTYYGPLTKPIDFTQAHPLQCAYPATPPHVGDYETVSDTLPTPGPDSGYYYVTAATYQGQTRYGRKTTNGHLSGRDPSLLPACVAP